MAPMTSEVNKLWSIPNTSSTSPTTNSDSMYVLLERQGAPEVSENAGLQDCSLCFSLVQSLSPTIFITPGAATHGVSESSYSLVYLILLFPKKG